MIDEREYKRLKRQADEAQTAHDRAEGQLEAAYERLEEDFGCSDLEEAEAELKKLERAATKAEAAYNAAKDDFEEEYAERIGG